MPQVASQIRTSLEPVDPGKGPTAPDNAEPMRMAFAYNNSWRHVTERYLSDTFPPGCAIHFDLDVFEPNVSILDLLEDARRRGVSPDVFSHLVHTPALPHDLHLSPVRTASLDIDSFGWTISRIRWSMLFDYVFVWHPSLAPLYRAAGHPKVIALAHAADGELFGLNPIREGRPFDLGWVGAFNYAHYDRRRQIIQDLASRFRMNEYGRRYTKEDTADVYKRSKIVVNVSREDFPQEANMRCYEAMAAGALLITGMPTELTEWGFREGEHFIGWRSEAEIPDLVDRYLRHEQRREGIARAGQDLTLRDFTFQRCRDKIISVLGEQPNEFFAPARKWSDEEVRLVYLEYYYRYQLCGPAYREFGGIRSFGGYWKGVPMMLKAVRNALKGKLQRHASLPASKKEGN